MKRKTVTVDGRPPKSVGHPWQPAEGVATFGWISMAFVVVVALMAATYAPF